MGMRPRRFKALKPTLLRSAEEVQIAFDENWRQALWIVPRLSGMSRRHGIQKFQMPP
jgi:hypothetical protein